MKEDSSLPLHLCRVQKSAAIINRSHALLHSMALTALIYYRAFSLLHDTKTRNIPMFLPCLMVFASELLLSFIWLLEQAYRWRPVSRTVFPERLPEDKELPAIDIFICTADPNKEPTVEVMNTVLSAMALDYPPEKIHVYVSDDGGSFLTLHAMREAWRFARWWLPFCRRYGIKTRCPEPYFLAMEDDCFDSCDTEFRAERRKIKGKYEVFKEQVAKAIEDGGIAQINNSRDHPPLIQLRVSGMMSNASYILVLDCDMYCNDPTSARQAMCFHLDPNISTSLAFVQFPQKFHNISNTDIYDAQLRSAFTILWHGFDGLKGPVVTGTGFYIKREALYGRSIQEDINLTEIKQCFGPSTTFVKSLRQNYKPNNVMNDQDSSYTTLLHETQLLATSAYENKTKWGEEARIGLINYFTFHLCYLNYIIRGAKIRCT